MDQKNREEEIAKIKKKYKKFLDSLEESDRAIFKSMNE